MGGCTDPHRPPSGRSTLTSRGAAREEADADLRLRLMLCEGKASWRKEIMLYRPKTVWTIAGVRRIAQVRRIARLARAGGVGWCFRD